MQPTKRWLAVVGALCVSAWACGGDDDSGTGRTATPGVIPPTMPIAGASAGTAGGAAPAMQPTMTMTVMPTAGSGAPTMMPTAGSGAPTMMPTAGSGAPTMTTAGSAAPMTTPGDPSMCPAAPDGTGAPAMAALLAINTARLAAGAGCVKMVAEINKAADAHCSYYAMNAKTDCTANAHMEVMSCMGFTGADPGARLKAAGYKSQGWGEVMAFENNPQGAVDTWINSVWHRIPMLDPWSNEMGYGSAASCDTMDFGNGGTAPADTVLVYPYDGQTNVPTSFNGMYEGPMPPAPASGWPSASVITVYGKKLNITEHVLTKDGDTAPIAHTWLTGTDPMWGSYLRTSVMIYADAPFAANTKYRMKVSGTYQGGDLTREWTFTTGAAPVRGRF